MDKRKKFKVAKRGCAKPDKKLSTSQTKVGLFLKRCRLRVGLKRREVADQLGLVRTYSVYELETGSVLPGLQYIKKLAWLYGVTTLEIREGIAEAKDARTRKRLGLPERKKYADLEVPAKFIQADGKAPVGIYNFIRAESERRSYLMGGNKSKRPKRRK